MSSDPRNDYLAAYRRSVATPPAVRDANLQAVFERAAAIEAEPAPASRWAASVLVLKITTAALITTGLGWAAVSAVSSEDTTDAPVAAVAAPEPTPSPAPAPAPEAPPSPPAQPPAAPEVTAAPGAPAPIRPRAAVPSETSEASDRLREEIALLESAQTHLVAGRLIQAEQSLREHARRFPRGSLAVERTAWRAIVACSANGSQPKAAARSFLLTHGDSPLGAKVKAKCGL